MIVFDETSSKVVKFDEQQESVGEGNMFTINSLDYNTTNVFLMARVVNPKLSSRVEFNFIYEEDLGMHAGAILAIIFSILIFIASVTLLVIWILN